MGKCSDHIKRAGKKHGHDFGENQVSESLNAHPEIAQVAAAIDNHQKGQAHDPKVVAMGDNTFRKGLAHSLGMCNAAIENGSPSKLVKDAAAAFDKLLTENPASGGRPAQ